ncbi:cyanophycinase [Empedobacter falsenii]|uniref:Cyanophycinase n=2 Tax=Empedobacter TaxID=59734 RepID=A0ABY8V6S9_9FLAO|nr:MULTISPECIES: cyanophycinase [Empedobacter]MCA4777990.1 cyanophycinase [Empedobacter stercoris]MCA4810640.1 cyanophycinase [Empedobacter stercoris]MDM1523577.1 cyanophycinase [Empedobacter sp. 225-1]NOJ76299.1 cyanophycinase [Empedobacter stercoris]QNT14003.1 cyanophycinase [Empedobacter stercoris]
MSIKGKLIIVGGGINTAENIPPHLPKQEVLNDFFYQNGILKKIIEESKHKENSRIEIITTASQTPKIAAESYIKAFSLLDAHNVEHLDINTRLDAIHPESLKRLDEADVVLFSGGDQLRLTSTIGGTPFQQKLLQKYYHEEFIYAGTSAGAAAVSSSMIYQGVSSDALLKGAVEMNSGLGLIDSILVDTHFIQRGRIGRLFQAVTGNPMKIGIGLSEDTGLIISENNNKMTAIGSGSIILVDGREILDTSLSQIEIGYPISISHIICHVMTRNDVFHLDQNKISIKDSQYNNQ